MSNWVKYRVNDEWEYEFVEGAAITWKNEKIWKLYGLRINNAHIIDFPPKEWVKKQLEETESKLEKLKNYKRILLESY